LPDAELPFAARRTGLSAATSWMQLPRFAMAAPEPAKKQQKGARRWQEKAENRLISEDRGYCLVS